PGRPGTPSTNCEKPLTAPRAPWARDPLQGLLDETQAVELRIRPVDHLLAHYLEALEDRVVRVERLRHEVAARGAEVATPEKASRLPGVVRVVAEGAAPGAEHATELLQVAPDDVALEVHHRVPAVDQRDRVVGDRREVEAVVLDERHARVAGEPLAAVVDVLVEDVDDVEALRALEQLAR